VLNADCHWKEALEKLLSAKNDVQNVQPAHSADAVHQSCLYEASVLLVKELQRLGNGQGSINHGQSIQGTSVLNDITTNQESTRHEHANSSSPAVPHEEVSRKRKRSEASPHGHAFNSDTVPIPFPHLLQTVIEVYFDVVQHWIPFLHRTRFQSRMADAQERPKLEILLHAIVTVTLRLIDTTGLGMSQAEIDQKIQASRNYVLLRSMDSLSVENLQALIIIAFDYASFPFMATFLFSLFVVN
jgi:hypothetical protein